MGCFGNSSDWKREEVLDHKFDFIDVREYRDNGAMTQLKYTLLYANMAKSVGVYLADIYTAITLLVMGHLTGSPYAEAQNDKSNLSISVEYIRWIFTGCIIFSFLLLAYEAHKARAIVRSRDISYAYTNIMANNWYSLNSYDHFCFFLQINNSTKKQDEFAFFIFFTFKGWKRLLVADGPRQVINAFVLFSVAASHDFTSDVYKYYNGNVLTGIMLLTMCFTVVVFAASALLLAVAAMMYIPLIMYIKGNLKEYCCHKIDKRISELVRRKKKSQLARQMKIAHKEANGDFSHLRNKKGELVRRAIPQPTLPTVEVDLFSDSGSTLNNKGGKPGDAKNGYAASIAGTDTGALGGYDLYSGQDSYGAAMRSEDHLFGAQAQHQFSHSHQGSDLQSLHQQQQQAGGYGGNYGYYDEMGRSQTPGMDGRGQYGGSHQAAGSVSGMDIGMQPLQHHHQQQQQHQHSGNYEQEQQFYDQHFAASGGYGDYKAERDGGVGGQGQGTAYSDNDYGQQQQQQQGGYFAKANTPSPPMQAQHQQGYGPVGTGGVADGQGQEHHYYESGNVAGVGYALDQDQQQYYYAQQQQQQTPLQGQTQQQQYDHHHQQQDAHQYQQQQYFQGHQYHNHQQQQ